jgi:hypothetical protein
MLYNVLFYTKKSKKKIYWHVGLDESIPTH